MEEPAGYMSHPVHARSRGSGTGRASGSQSPEVASYMAMGHMRCGGICHEEATSMNGSRIVCVEIRACRAACIKPATEVLHLLQCC